MCTLYSCGTLSYQVRYPSNIGHVDLDQTVHRENRSSLVSRTANTPWYWVTQKLPQICTVILRIRIGKVA